MTPFRILSLDGGGIRGLLSAMLLERIENGHPGFLAQIDLIAGTSTGGLLALGLAAGKSPHEARKLYEAYGSKVFADNLWDEIRDLGTLIGADYSLQPLREALQELFSTKRLSELNKRVLISAFDLDNNAYGQGNVRSWKAKFFHNFPGDESDGERLAVDVGLYTSAAPTYFPVVDGFIDGGVVAGNPSMCAVAQALHAHTGGQKLEDIVLISIGTGHNPRYLETQDGDWGLVQWAPHMINLMFEGSSGLADYQCRQLLGERYFRLNPVLPIPISMDRVDQMPALRRIAAQQSLIETMDWISQNFQP